MGLDGGTIITRSDVLRGQSWRMAQSDSSKSTRGGDASGFSGKFRTRDEQQCLEERRRDSWRVCSISGEPLRCDELVCCEKGRLYNMQSVVEHLLSKKNVHVTSATRYRYENIVGQSGGEDVNFGHLKTRKSVFSLKKFETNSSNDPVCPVTGVACYRSRCLCMRPCGHVASEKAVEQGGGTTCVVCNAPVVTPIALNTKESDARESTDPVTPSRKRRKKQSRGD
mmetsp:Transcript_532/g.1233  ORF Transcript_532/g.1233 Transcript_532/m.1233 type:complete len:225 (-) Transcript_532:237-911(-)